MVSRLGSMSSRRGTAKARPPPACGSSPVEGRGAPEHRVAGPVVRVRAPASATCTATSPSTAAVPLSPERQPPSSHPHRPGRGGRALAPGEQADADPGGRGHARVQDRRRERSGKVERPEPERTKRRCSSPSRPGLRESFARTSGEGRWDGVDRAVADGSSRRPVVASPEASRAGRGHRRRRRYGLFSGAPQRASSGGGKRRGLGGDGSCSGSGKPHRSPSGPHETSSSPQGCNGGRRDNRGSSRRDPSRCQGASLPRRATIVLLLVAFFLGPRPPSCSARVRMPTHASDRARPPRRRAPAARPNRDADAGAALAAAMPSGSAPTPAVAASPVPDAVASVRVDGQADFREGGANDGAAVDAVAAGAYGEAARKYAELAQQHPERPVYREAARILRARLDAGAP